VYFSDFSTLQSDNHMSKHSLGLVLSNHCGESASAPAENGSSLWQESHAMDLRSWRYKMKWQTIAPKRRLRGQNTRIDMSTHTLDQFFWYTGTVACNDIAGPQSFRGNYVVLFSRLLVCDEGKMGAPVGIVFYAVDRLFARLHSREVDHAYPSSCTASMMSHCDLSSIVPAAFRVPHFRECELSVWRSFPEMVVDRLLQVTQARSPWCECFQQSAMIA
jgi:hypothetical protein